MNPFIEFISELVETIEHLSESLQILEKHMIIDEEEKRFYQKENVQ